MSPDQVSEVNVGFLFWPLCCRLTSARLFADHGAEEPSQ